MSRATVVALCALGSALVVTACDSATAPVSSLRPAASASAIKGGGGDDKDACKEGGFANYTRADGSLFKNQGDCVSYVAGGGQLLPKTPPPSITYFFFTGFSLGTLGVEGVFDGGVGTVTDPTGAVTPIQSGQPITLASHEGTYTLTVTNAVGVSVSQSTVCDYNCANPGFNRIGGVSGRIGGG